MMLTSISNCADKNNAPKFSHKDNKTNSQKETNNIKKKIEPTETETSIKSERISQPQNKSLLYKINLLKHQNIPLTIEDLQSNYIYSINNSNIGNLNRKILEEEKGKINTEEKIVKWINQLHPKTHVFLLLATNKTIEPWKENLALPTSGNVKVYVFSLNEDSGTINTYHWPSQQPDKIFTDLPPKTNQNERSLHIKHALKETADHIFSTNISSEAHWVSSLSENADGHLFNGQLKKNDLVDALTHWTRIARSKNLGIIDFAFKGKKSSFYDLSNFCPFSSHFISSEDAISEDGTTLNSLIQKLSNQTNTNIELLSFSEHKKRESSEKITLFNCAEFTDFQRQLEDKKRKSGNRTIQNFTVKNNYTTNIEEIKNSDSTE